MHSAPMNGLAISLASRSGASAIEVAGLARLAETVGFEAFFVAERCADSLALAHSALLATQRLTVGTAIANAAIRHPVSTAMTATTLAEESGGRFRLGLGMANVALNEVALGLPPARALVYMREYVAVLRAVLNEQPDPPAGEYFSVSGFRLDRPPTVSVPIWLAGLLPRMLSLAGELGDGALLNLMSTAQLPSTIGHIETGLARAGRPREQFVVACLIPCCISPDLDAAARAAREVVSGYALHPAAGQLFSASGFADELAEVRERLTGGDENAAASVSDAMIDALVVHGGPDALPERVHAYREAGVDLPVLFPMPVDDGWLTAIDRVLRAVEQFDFRPTESPSLNRKDAQHV